MYPTWYLLAKPSFSALSDAAEDNSTALGFKKGSRLSSLFKINSPTNTSYSGKNTSTASFNSPSF